MLSYKVVSKITSVKYIWLQGSEKNLEEKIVVMF